MTFPSRVLIQCFKEKIPPDYEPVVAYFTGSGVEILLKTSEELISLLEKGKLRDFVDEKTLVVGDFEWTKAALKTLQIDFPQPPDYPQSLEKYLHRKIWQSTLADVHALLSQDCSFEVFIKPATQAKVFSAIIEPKDQMLESLLHGIPGVLPALPPSLLVTCSEVVEMHAEFRVYILRGKICAICCYKRSEETAGNQLDIEIVESAVKDFSQSEEGQHVSVGCAMDFAVMRRKVNGPGISSNFFTGLVEVNDGYSLGRYEGISGDDYTRLLCARWESLIHAKK